MNHRFTKAFPAGETPHTKLAPWPFLRLAAIAWLFCGSAWAQVPITTISNPGFESPVIAEGVYNQAPAGWAAYNCALSTHAYAYNPYSFDDFTTEAPEGQNVGAVWWATTSTGERGMSQTLSTLFQVGDSYQLSVKVGYSNYFASSAPGPGYRVELLAGDTVIGSVDQTTGGIPAFGGFVSCTVNYAYDTAHADLAGQQLKIRLINRGLTMTENEVAFDDVKLFAVLANPFAHAGGPYYLANPAASLSLNATASLPSGTATLTNPTSYAWDLDNDGAFDDATGATPAAISYADLLSVHGMVDGSNPIRMRVTDSSGKTAIADATVEMVTSTKYTGPNVTNADSWNIASNWDNGTPQGDFDVVILAGKSALAWANATPIYTGNLTLQNGASLKIGHTSAVLGSYNALGIPGMTKITMNPGSAITTVIGGTAVIPEIQLLGNVLFGLSAITYGPSANWQFNYPITGPYELQLQGKDQATSIANFNVPNTFNGIYAAGAPYIDGGLTIKGNAAGSLGTGNITIAKHRTASTSYAILEINAANAMADTATLSISGTSTTMLRMNANDTIAAFIFNGATQPPGTYGSTSSSATYKFSWITGTGILTVGTPAVGYWDLNGVDAWAGGATPSGTWNNANTYWNNLSDGSGSVAAWTAGNTAIFSAGIDATGSFAVDVAGSHDISGFIVRNGAISLTQGSGGNLRLTANGSFSVNSGSSSIATPISQDAASRSLSVTNVGNLTLSGALSHTGGTILNGGTLVLAGNNSAASGATTVNAGVLFANAVNSIPGTIRTVTINSSGTLAFASSFGAGNIQTALNNRIVTSSEGTIAANNYATSPFNFDTPGLTAAYFGALGDVNYTGALTPQGTSYRLSGEGGTLTMVNANAITGARSLTVRGSVMLAANNNFTGATTVLTNAALSLLGSTTTSGITMNTGSTLTIGNNGSLGSGTLTLAGLTTLKAVNNTTVVTTNAVAANSDFSIAGTGNLTLGAITINASRTISNISSGTTTLGSITNGASNLSLTIDGFGNTVVSGNLTIPNGTFTKNSSGTLTLNGTANTYLVTNINGGVLRLNGGATGAGSTTIFAAGLQLGSSSNGGLPTGTITISNPAAFIQAVDADRSISNNLILDNNLTFSGSNSLTINGKLTNNNANRTLTNNIISTKALTLGNVDLSQDATNRILTISGTGNTVINGVIQSGGGSIVSTLAKSGSGQLTLNGANTYAGPTTMNANSGELVINGSLGASAITINSGSKLLINGSIGAGAITMNGTSRLTIDGSTGAGNVIINNGATLLGTGTIGGNTFIGNGGKLEFNLASPAADHDKLELAPGRALSFLGSSLVTMTGIASNGTYTLLTAPGGITGPLPSLVYPDGWDASLAINGNDLQLIVAYSGNFPDHPTLVSIADNKSGGPVDIFEPITYTITFNEDMNASTVTSSDFGNAGTAAITYGNITETTPGVFTMQVTPTAPGTLQLRINQGAKLVSALGSNLITTSALLDNNTLNIVVPANGVLAVTSGDFITAKGPDGPFIPSSKTYTLTNYGGQALDWTVAKTAAWLDLDTTGGNLASQASTTVTVTANSDAYLLEIGAYFDAITFTNTTSGLGNTTRGVSLAVNGFPVVVTLGNLNQTYDGTPKAASVTTNPVSTYSLTYNGFAEAPTEAGSYDIVATVTETGYTGIASGTLVINKASQTITFAELAPVDVSQSSITLTATSTSALPVVFTSSNNNVATVTGNTVTIIGAGTTTITAEQAGNGNYQAATSVSRTLSVVRLNPLAVPGGPYAVSNSAALALNGNGSLASSNQTITSYAWDLDVRNDGGGAFTADVTTSTPAAISMATLQNTYGMVVGNNTIRLRVTDSANKTSTVSTTVLVIAQIRWDANAGTALQPDGAGDWYTAGRWWDTGALTNVNWGDGGDVIFGNGGNGGLANVSAPTIVGSMTFSPFNGTYTLGTNALTINGGITQNAGSGGVTISSPVLLGAAQTWTNNSSNNLTLSSTLNNLGSNLTIDGSGTINLHLGIVSGSGGIIKNGSGRLVFSAGGTLLNHTFSGSVVINGGQVFHQEFILPPGNITINNGSLQAYWSGTMRRTLGSGPGQIQILGGISGFGGSRGGVQISFNNDVTTEVVWGSQFFNPSEFELAPTPGDSSFIAFNNFLDLNGANRTLRASNAAGGGSVQRAIRNSSATNPAGLIKTGPGQINLNASNTYNGGTTLQAGTLQLGNVSALGASVGTLTVNGGLLNLNNMAAVSVGNLTGTGGIIANNGAGASTFTIGNGGGTGGIFQGVIANNTNAGAGTLALTKTGTGSITLSGANTYTGATNINGGKLFINGSSAGSAISVASGASLGGSGTLSGALTVAAGGGIDPGASGSVGTLNVNNNVAVTSGIWNIDLNTTAPAIDRLNITGNLTLTGAQTINLNVLNGTPDGTYTFATWTGSDPALVTWNLPQTSGTYWTGVENLLWDAPNNWTPSTINSVAQSGKNLQLTFTTTLLGPISTSNIFIEPSANTSLTGPASGGKQTVNNLTIGQGAGSATLTLQAGGNLNVAGATTVSSGGTLNATAAGLITPTLNVNGGSVTLGNAAGNVTTANITAGTLTVNHAGAANLSAFLNGTGNLAGSAAVFQVNVNGGMPTFTGLATTMTVTGGGITTTGGTIGTFNSTTGAGTSTIGTTTSITTANVNVGTVNFNSTQANGTLAVTGGTTNIGTGAKITTADFTAGTGTVNGTNPLSIINQLKLAGNTTATLTGGTSFTAAGTNLADNNTARTLSISGGTLALKFNSVPAAALRIDASVLPLGAITTLTNLGTGGSSLAVNSGSVNVTASIEGKNALAFTGANAFTSTTAYSLTGSSAMTIFTVASTSATNSNSGYDGYLSFNASNGADYNTTGSLAAITADNGGGTFNPYRNNGSLSGVGTAMPQGPANPFITAQTFTGTTSTFKVINRLGVATTAATKTTVGGNFNITKTAIGARWGNATNLGNYWNGAVGEILVYNSLLNATDISTVETYLKAKWFGIGTGTGGAITMPQTSVAATLTSTLDLSGATDIHNLAALNLTAGSTTTALSLKNGTTLTLNGDTNNNAISATGATGHTASILPDATSPPSLVIAAGKNVSVDPNVALTVQSVISGGDLTKIGTGSLTLTGTNTYTGTTTVNAGKLFVNGSIGAGNVTISSSATLGGAGIIGGNTTIASGGKLEFNLSTVPASHNPLDIATGKNLAFSGASELTITSSGGIAAGTYVLVTGGNSITGVAPVTLNLPIGYLGSVSIVGNELRLQLTAVTSYNEWAAAAPFADDANNDGVDNGLAWYLGAANPNAAANSLLPIIDRTSDPVYIIFNYRRSQNAATAGAVGAVKYSSNLTGWTTATAGPDVVITPTTNGYATGIDKVEVKIRRTLAVNNKMFIYLDVTE